MSKFKETEGYELIHKWMESNSIKPFPFQEKTWAKYHNGYSGMVIAPTGFGKTYSVFLALIIDYLNHPEKFKKGLKLLWISPLRSLAKDLQRAMQEAIDDIGLDWIVETRNGDTDQKIRQRQTRSMPDILITTPETLHLLFAMKKNSRFFKSLHCVAVDEWHELLGNKRGVLTELAISKLNYANSNLKIWGITATIGNLEEAMEVLIPYDKKKLLVTTRLKKKTKIQSVLPDNIEVLPWAGHLGSKLVDKIVKIIDQSQSSLIFTNTRSQAEMWFQIILDEAPHLAGLIALHHGSIDRGVREWIEENLSSGVLKAVVCTSSLDLGVDFKPVDTTIQIGSVKGVARLLQRAGRSGHSPHETSKIYFVPTHTLELIEISAVKEAFKRNIIEKRKPVVNCYDVLVQFMVTVAVGEGFKKEEIKEQVMSTHAFKWLNDDEFEWALVFITKGSDVLSRHNDFLKVECEDDLYIVKNRRVAMLHRMNIGVIVGDSMVRVKFMGGKNIGMVEEYFISKLKKGDKFILSGRVLQLIIIKELTAYVKLAKGKAIAPSWLGGRLPLSSNLSSFMREKLSDALEPNNREVELKFLHPLLQQQDIQSHIPNKDEFLIEKIKTRDGYHLFMYPFEGRLVHEVFASLVAYRISKIKAMSVTMAMNDYGFELLSDQPFPIDENNSKSILSSDNLMNDVAASVQISNMASRKFRDIAVISGLVVQNFHNKTLRLNNLQSSAGIVFKVFEDFDPHNLLYRQAFTEVFNEQFEEERLRDAFQRISTSKIIFKESKAFTPLSFPIKVDSLRASLSNEKLATRIARMQKLKS